MTHANEVQAAVVASLKDIPELVEALGGNPLTISGFDPELGEFRTADEAIHAMTEASVMVVTSEIDEALRGEIPRWRYSFEIVLVAPGEIAQTVGVGITGVHPGYFSLLQSIVDGIVTATGQRWLDSPVHAAFDPPADLRFRKGRVDGTEIWVLAFSLIEIGG